MSYNPTQWLNNSAPPINDVNLNKIEGGIESAHITADTHIADVSNPHGITTTQIGAIPSSEKGANSGVATLDSAGKLPAGQLPSISLTDVSVVADIAERDLLVVQEGDVAIVTTEGKSYIYGGASWVEMSASVDVTTVAGRIGDVVLVGTDIGITDGSTVFATDDAQGVADTVAAHVTDVANPHGVTLAQLGGDVDGAASAVQSNLDAHTINTTNPHAVTATQVGADPIGSASTVQGNLDTHTVDVTNPHVVTAAQVGADPIGSSATVQTNLNTHTANVTNPHNVDASQVGAIPTSEKGAINGVATLDGTGIIPSAQLPPIAVTEVHVVANIAARDLLVPIEGDVAVLQDTGDTYIWDGTAWQSMNNGANVSSVNGYTGTVSLTAADVGAPTTTDLTTHTTDVTNPHVVTLAQIGAEAAGSSATVQSNLDTHTIDTTNPHSVTAAQAGADATGTAASAVTAHESGFGHLSRSVSDVIAAGGETTLATPIAFTNINQVDVWLNGLKQIRGSEYTDGVGTPGSEIDFSSALSVSDNVEIIVWL